MVTKAQMKMEQFDVCTAFLDGDIDVEIFMEQPLGFRSMMYPDWLCFLLQSLCGLK